MSEEVPSREALDTLVQVALDERALGFQALDALDTKAGILLAVDGLLIAAATQADNAWLRGATITAFVIAATPSLWALRVSAYEQIGVKALTEHYLTASPTGVRQQVLAKLVEQEATFERTRDQKGNNIRLGFWLTAAALSLLAVGAFIPA